MSESALPFTLKQIQAIKWIPGEPLCIVTYKDQEGMTARSKKVSLIAMEAVRSNFKRFLVCATACSLYEGHKNKAVADKIKRWDRLVSNRLDTRYLFDRNTIHSWADLSRFDFLVGPTRNGKSTAVCTMSFGAGSAGTFDCALLDATCPGFTEFCTILCVENGLDDMEVFQGLSRLSSVFSYETLEANVQNFANQLRSCAPLGLSMADMLRVLKTSDPEKIATALELPDLDPPL